MENKNVEEICRLIEAKLKGNYTPYKNINAIYNFVLTDVDDGVYQLELTNGAASIHNNKKAGVDCTLKMKEKYFRKFLQGDLNSTTAFMTGKIKVDGNIGMALKLENMLKQYDFTK